MPIPVSAISKHARTCRPRSAAASTRRTTSPCSVNLTALPTRLLSTCRRRPGSPATTATGRSEEHTSELQSLRHLVCRLLLEKKKKNHSQGKHIKTSKDMYRVEHKQQYVA